MEGCCWIAEFKERAFSSTNSEDSILNDGLVDIHIRAIYTRKNETRLK